MEKKSNGAVIAIEYNVPLDLLPVHEDVSCPGISQRLDIAATGGPLTIQISGANTSLINIVIDPLRGNGSTDLPAEP